MKRPAFQFYPADWLKDPALRACSIEARGLWIDMLCLMHESPRRGYLQHVNGGPVSPEQLGRMTGCQTDRVAVLLSELESVGVFSRAERDVIFNRRMARDESKRELCQEAGKRGGNPVLMTLNRGVKGGSKGDANPPPTPSSSSSASASSSEQNRREKDGREGVRVLPQTPPSGQPRGWNRAQAINEIIAAFPPSNGSAHPNAIRQALYRLGGTSGEAVYSTEADAAVWLKQRVIAWAKSPQCRTTPQRFRKSMGAWFSEAMYDAPDEAWQVPYSADEPAKVSEFDKRKANGDAVLAQLREIEKGQAS